MNLKNLLFILLLPTLSFSQSKIHLDENMEEISSSRYKIKCGYHIFKCLKYTTDSLEVNKVLYKYSFGKIDSTTFKQIQTLLASHSRKKINPSETIVIKYSDSIKGLKTLKSNYDKHVITCHANHKAKELNDFQNDRNEWVEQKQKCFKKLKKDNNVSFNYVYKNVENIDVLETYNNFVWVKDRGVFKNLFLK